MTADDLTPPERRCDRDRGWRLVDRIKADPCGHCVRGVGAWGRSVCGLTPSRTFPACLDQSPGFALPDDTDARP